MKQLLLALAIILNLKTMAQIQPVKETPVPLDQLSDYEVNKDPENGQKVYKGIFSYKDLIKDASFTWLPKGMADYTPDPKAMKYLNDHLRSYDMRVFMGTWCSDSHEMIPKLYKVLQGINFMSLDNLVIGMDRSKTTKERYMAQVKDMHVTMVPTIILINNSGQEAGRIVETVDRSVEEDLAKIIKDDLKRK